MTRRFAVQATLVVLLLCAVRISAQESPVGVWRLAKMRWVNAPKGLPKEKTGNTVVLRFAPGGAFALIQGSIIQQQHGFQEHLSQGDPWTIYTGTWKRDGQWVTVTYTLLYRDIEFTGRDGMRPCDPPRTAAVVLQGNSLVFDGERYEFNPRLEKSVNDTFSPRPGLPKSQCGAGKGATAEVP